MKSGKANFEIYICHTFKLLCINEMTIHTYVCAKTCNDLFEKTPDFK